MVPAMISGTRVDYLNVKVMPFAKVAPQVVCQISGSDNIPAIVTGDHDLNHFVLFREISVLPQRYGSNLTRRSLELGVAGLWCVVYSYYPCCLVKA
jgi:hypothetical protein